MGHGRCLVNIDTRQDQIDIYEKIVGKNLSVRETESMVRDYHKAGTSKMGTGKKTSTLTPVLKEGMEELKQYLGAGVRVNSDGKAGGKISISFKDAADFQRLKKRITGA